MSASAKEHYYRAVIQEAEAIRKKIRGGKLFGEPIDMQNADEVIVAAYFIGLLEEQKRQNSRMPLAVKGGDHV